MDKGNVNDLRDRFGINFSQLDKDNTNPLEGSPKILRNSESGNLLRIYCQLDQMNDDN